MKRPYIHEVRKAIKASAHEITAHQVAQAWRESPLARLSPYILDARFRCVDLDTWRTILAWSKVDKYDYQADTRDCDNFAAALHGNIPLRFGVNTVAYVIDFSGKHAYSALIYHDDRQDIGIAVVEPQTDGFVQVGQQVSEHEIYKARTGFAIIG